MNLSTVERQAFIKKHNLQINSTHTLIFFDKKIGTRTPIVTLEIHPNEFIIRHNPDNIDLHSIVRKIKSSL